MFRPKEVKPPSSSQNDGVYTRAGGLPARRAKPLIYRNARCARLRKCVSMDETAKDLVAKRDRLRFLAAWYREWAVLAGNDAERACRLRLAAHLDEKVAAITAAGVASAPIPAATRASGVDR